MAAELTKQALDVGIVAVDCPRMLAFYRDVLGLPEQRPVSFPGVTIHRLTVGESMLRIVELDTPPTPSADGDLFSSTGLRYLTLSVGNLDQVIEDCREFGVNVPRPPSEIRPGVFAARVQDPDGNWMELQSG